MVLRIFRNLWLKVFAVILAIITWMGVHNSIETSETFIYSVRILLPSQVKAKEISPEKFSVTISGPNELIKSFRSSLHIYEIDLSNIQEDETFKRIVSIDPKAINIPASLSIRSISDEKVTITLDPLIQKELIVECDIVDKPAPGYIIAGRSVRPSRISRELPSKDAKSITRIMTSPISVSAATSNVMDRVSLVDPLDPSKRLDVFADITIFIQPDLIEKEFKDITVSILRAPNDKREVILQSDKISVTLKGRRDIMETFDKSKLMVYLDIIKQEAGDYELQPVIQPVEGVSTVKVQSVKYTIKP